MALKSEYVPLFGILHLLTSCNYQYVAYYKLSNDKNLKPDGAKRSCFFFTKLEDVIK